MFDIKEIEKFDNYPVHLKKEIGEELIKIFNEKQLEKSNNKFFVYEFNFFFFF